MVLIIILVILPFIFIISGILYFNIHFRRQIKKDLDPAPVIDQAYLEAERTRPDDADLGGSNEGPKKEAE